MLGIRGHWKDKKTQQAAKMPLPITPG